MFSPGLNSNFEAFEAFNCHTAKNLRSGNRCIQASWSLRNRCEHLPLTTFRRCVARYCGQHKVKRPSLFRSIPVHGPAQLTFGEVCAISKRVFAQCPPNCATWASAAPCRAKSLANGNATRLAHLLRIRTAFDRYGALRLVGSLRFDYFTLLSSRVSCRG